MKRFLLSIFVLCFTFYSNAQNPANKADLNSAGTIQDQYDYLWNESGKYQTNKVVKMSLLNQFNSNVQDSLEAGYALVSGSSSELKAKQEEFKALGLKKDSLDLALEEAKTDRDAFEFLGIKTSKASFRVLFFVISGFLLGLALFSLFRMRSKSGQASDDKSRYETLELEFENFKKRSREKEQVLARQLQDEINKRL